MSTDTTHEILHQEEGLTIRRNARNRFAIISWSFRNDPQKRSKEWIEETKRGMKQADWEQEYELSYTSKFGAKIFPQFADRKAEIVFPTPPDQEAFLEGMEMWGGFDYGPYNPSSFHVYALDAKQKVTWVVYELYEPCRNVSEFASKMMACPWWQRINYIAADPSIFRNDQQSEFGVVSINDLFIEHGVKKLMGGNKDFLLWQQKMNQYWPIDPGEPVTLKIWDCCRMLIKEAENAIYRPMSERQRETANYAEEMMKKNDHALDDLKYFVLSDPRIPSKTRRKLDMTKMWRH